MSPHVFALAVVYGKQGRLDDAVREYEAVLSADPDSARTHYNLALVRFRQGGVNEAIGAAEKAYALGLGRAGDLLNALQRSSSPGGSRNQPGNAPRRKVNAYPEPPKLTRNVRFGYWASDSVPDDDESLPSGYRRSDYHLYVATDDDIEYWGLDQPGAPAPWDAATAVWEVLDEMEADSDGFFDDAWDDPFF